jgi:DNA-binding NarL/FixJ family response regulator
MSIKVGIVEDQKQTREGLAVLINGSDGFICENAYETAEEALIEIPNLNLDVVLMDVHLPGMNGIDCVEKLKHQCRSIQFLMHTSFEDTDIIFNALKAGASGYLLKTTPPSKILEAIIDVNNGGSPMSSQIARKVVDSFCPENNKNFEIQKLSEREREILNLLSQGLRYKEIAGKLFLSVETIRTHIRNIYEKLHVNSRTEALNKTHLK